MHHDSPKRASTPDLVAAGALVFANSVMLRVGLRRRIDGWRRAAGVLLRDEASSFFLSTFGLDVWSDVPGAGPRSVEESQAHVVGRLERFLAGEKAAQIRIAKSRYEDRVEAASGPSCTIAFEPWADGPQRFVQPRSWRAPGSPASDPHAGHDPLVNIVFRINPAGECDAWFRFNHVAIDGVPAQGILNHLEAAWGTRAPVVYPTPEDFAPHIALRELAGRPGLAEMQMFLDLAPLLEWRKRENAKLPEPMTVSAAVSWLLARHAAFERVYIGSTVEIAPVDDLGPGVSMVVAHPARYSSSTDGLARYVREFNREVELVRTRRSIGCKTLDAAALVPARLAGSLIGNALDRDPRAFGGIGLTILKDAKVFGAPIASAGHERGFIAMGSAALPTADGRRVASITVKGALAHIADYPRLLREALWAG